MALSSELLSNSCMKTTLYDKQAISYAAHFRRPISLTNGELKTEKVNEKGR